MSKSSWHSKVHRYINTNKEFLIFLFEFEGFSFQILKLSTPQIVTLFDTTCNRRIKMGPNIINMVIKIISLIPSRFISNIWETNSLTDHVNCCWPWSTKNTESSPSASMAGESTKRSRNRRPRKPLHSYLARPINLVQYVLISECLWCKWASFVCFLLPDSL